MKCMKCGNDNDKSRKTCWFCGVEMGLQKSNKSGSAGVKPRSVIPLYLKFLAAIIGALIIVGILAYLSQNQSETESHAISARQSDDPVAKLTAQIQSQQVAEKHERQQALDIAQKNTAAIQQLQEENKTLKAMVGADKPVENSKASDELAAFVRSYYAALDRRDVDAALVKWKASPKNFSALVKNIEYFKVNDVRVRSVDANHATVWVDVIGKTYSSANSERWMGDIALDAIAPGKWAITSLNLKSK